MILKSPPPYAMQLKLTEFSIKDFVKKNLFHKIIFKKNIFKLISLWIKGFDSNNILLYDLIHKNAKEYLPDSIRYKISLNTNTGYWPILHDKLIFYKFIKDELPTPEILAVIFEGKFLTLSKEFDIFNILKSDDEYVFKPLQGGKGNGIMFIRKQNDKPCIERGEGCIPLNENSLKKLIEKTNQYGIFRYYSQHSLLSCIYPKSANTIRMVTMWDIDKNVPFIFIALLRIGWDGSKPFDNFSQGGLVAKIDENTGLLSEWKRRSENGSIDEGDIHPNTLEPIKGKIIPHWNNIKNKILNYVEHNSFLDYVGWDILVTENDFVVIEGNHNPDIDLVQVHKPYLSDERAMKFFRNRKII
jgi:hypothetical protein